ncbi:GNAT family N-acetyltransferase [Pontiellaceae bacterium B12227]|nr:GNAT family N-acetyltransferase [Pontiellaceae bacterium B12227]
MTTLSKKIIVEKLEFSPELFCLESEWDALLERSSRPSIFSSFDFFYTSCIHASSGDQVFILLFRDASTSVLLAIFPMCVHRIKVHGIELLQLSHATTPWETDVDKPYPIIRKNHEGICWERLRAYFHKEYTAWDVITYDETFAESHLCQNLDHLFPFPSYWTRAKPGPESPIVKLDGKWEDFWMGHRKLRKKSRRLEKVLGDNLRYEVNCDPGDVEYCLNSYIAIELISWKAGEYVAQEEKQKFYRELFPKFSAKGRLYFGILYDKDKPISVEVAYVFKDQVYFAHGTYDPDYAGLSAGTVNSSRLLEFFNGQGYLEGDFLAGYAGYNNPWASRIEKQRIL